MMDDLLFYDPIRLLSIIGFLILHLLILLYGAEGGRRGGWTALGYLVAFDWALMMGINAERSTAVY